MPATPEPQVWPTLAGPRRPGADQVPGRRVRFRGDRGVRGRGPRRPRPALLAAGRRDHARLGPRGRRREARPRRLSRGRSAPMWSPTSPMRCMSGPRPPGPRSSPTPHDTDYGSRDFAVRDPEGNRWSFGTYRGEPRKALSHAGNVPVCVPGMLRRPGRSPATRCACTPRTTYRGRGPASCCSGPGLRRLPHRPARDRGRPAAAPARRDARPRGRRRGRGHRRQAPGGLRRRGPRRGGLAPLDRRHVSSTAGGTRRTCARTRCTPAGTPTAGTPST